MFSQEYWWLMYLIAIEFLTVLVFVAGSYVARLYFYFKKRHDEKLTGELIHLLRNGKPVPPYVSGHVEILLAVFKLLDTEQLPNWQQIKSQTMQTIIIPKIKHWVHSRNWQKRYLLALCLEQAYTPDDEATLIQLIQDKSAIVSFNAMQVASKQNKSELLRAILFRLQQEPHPFHVIATRDFGNSTQWQEVISKELNETADPWLRKICYEILRNLGAETGNPEMVKKDCYNPRVDVRLAAIRALPYLNKGNYLEIYSELIKDDDWLVRNAIVKNLRELQDPRSLNLLTGALHDPVRWVRVNAAKSLGQLGDEGLLTLAEFKDLQNARGYEEADYFLKIQKIRTESHAN